MSSDRTRTGGSSSKLLKGGAGIFACKFFGVIMALLASSMLTRNIPVGEFGIYSLVLSIVQVLVPIFCMGLPEILLRESSVRFSQGGLQAIQCLTNFAERAFLLITFLVGALIAVPYLADASWRSTGMWFSLPLLAFYPALYFVRGLIRGVDFAVISQLGETVFIPAFFLGALGVFIYSLAIDLSSGTVILLRVASVAAATCLSYWILILVSKRNSERNSDLPNIPGLKKSAFVFANIGLLEMFVRNAELLILGSFANVEDVAYFKVALMIVGVIAFLPFALNAVIGPQIARSFGSSDFKTAERTLVRAARINTVLIVLVTTLVFFVAESALEYVFGEEYGSSYKLLIVMCAGQCFSAIFGPVGVALNMGRNERSTLLGLGIAATVATVSNLILVPNYGALGAAISGVISIIVWKFALWVLLFRNTGVRSDIFRRVEAA